MLQHQHVIALHVQIRIVDPGGQIFEVPEYDRAPDVFEQAGVGCGALED